MAVIRPSLGRGLKRYVTPGAHDATPPHDDPPDRARAAARRRALSRRRAAGPRRQPAAPLGPGRGRSRRTAVLPRLVVPEGAGVLPAVARAAGRRGGRVLAN